MGKPKNKEGKERGRAPSSSGEPPKTPWELVIALFWNPPWKRWLILMPLLAVVTILQLVGKEPFVVVAEAAGLIQSPEIKCWKRTPRPEDSHIAGMRVIERVTMLDLSNWKDASDDELGRHVPVELAISRNRFAIERTDDNQACFIHRMGTTSGIEPTVHCHRCRKVALPQKDGVPLREWDLVFDIRDEPIGGKTVIEFSVDFWNSFQRQDQMWGGFRILHSTEKAIFSVVFPGERKPRSNSVRYGFVRSASQDLQLMPVRAQDLKVQTQQSHVERLTWSVSHPQPDRSYRVYWDW